MTRHLHGSSLPGQMGYRPHALSGKASIHGVNSVLNFPSGASCGSSTALITPWGGRRDELGHKPARALCAGVFSELGNKRDCGGALEYSLVIYHPRVRNHVKAGFDFGSSTERRRVLNPSGSGEDGEQPLTGAFALDTHSRFSARPAISFGSGAVNPQRKQTQFANRPSCEVSGFSWSESLS